MAKYWPIFKYKKKKLLINFDRNESCDFFLFFF